MSLRFVSVCDGIGAAPLAWRALGWELVYTSEIEPFPIAVTAQRFPGVPNLGDLTKFAHWSDEHGRIDLVCGGTPCQAFSVAGLRKGLDDPRGNLTLTYLALVAKLSPKWVVWENVPGVLSDPTGAFGAFLGGLGKLGYGFAYRVLDAQYVRVESHRRAVPQRRRRVFVIGHTGAAWQRAAAVLLESSSLCWNPPPRRTAGQGAAGGSGQDLAGGGWGAVSFDPTQVTSPDNYSVPKPGVCHPLARAQRPPAVALAFPQNLSGTQCAAAENLSPVLQAKNPMAVVTDALPEVAYALQHRDSKGVDSDTKAGHLIVENCAVRRLTPRECERLQGFPDDWTAVLFRGKPAADGPRYKALGNSMAVNVMRWIGERIELLERLVPNG